MGGLAQTIIQHYDDLDPTTAEADVSRFVDSLATHGLLA
jgi:hypothetical protein